MSQSRVDQISAHLAASESWKALPASVGDSVDAIDTPALVLDVDIMRANIRKMRAMVPPRVSLRPHYKTHKSNEIGALQLLEGAHGLCCAKLFEAETIAYRGVSATIARELESKQAGLTFRSLRLDILITNEIGIGGKKMARLGNLAKDLLRGPGRHPENRLGVCVDGIDQVKALSQTMTTHLGGNGTIDVYVELNHGGSRCGVDTPAQVVEIAKFIRSGGKGLVFRGIHAYLGTIQHIRKYDDRKAKNAQGAEIARTTVKMLEAEGFKNLVVTGSGTGSFEFDIVDGSVYTEIQVGSYLFMDRDYSLNLDPNGQMTSPFQPSLFIVSSIISHQPPRVVTDAGWKSVDMFVCFPSVVKPAADVEYIPGGDEHGILVPKGLRKRDGSVDMAKAAEGIKLFSDSDWACGQKVWYLGKRIKSAQTVRP